MDWNQDGKTSLREVVESTDIGARQVILNGTECVEYFFCKDGLPIKIVCRWQSVEKVAAVHNASKNFRQAEPQLTDSTLLENWNSCSVEPEI